MSTNKITYLYIDDESPDVINPYIKQLERYSASSIKINLKSPRPWDDQIQFIKTQTFDGIILDLRLDQSTMWEVEENQNKKAKYRAEDLAQRLRTLGTEKKLPDVPIILWSTDDRIKKSSFSKDSTPRDLFDLRVLKGDIIEKEYAERLSLQLIAISNAYIKLASFKGKGYVYQFLGWEKDPEFIDSRLYTFVKPKKTPPVHDMARYILWEIIQNPGVLIGRNILAARLGLDIEKSKDFDKLLRKIPESTRYKGVFSEGWERWWAYLLEEWWNDLEGSPGALRSLNAKERVDFIKEKTNLKKLSPYKPKRKKYSTKFWTVCHLTKNPLAVSDGFMLDFPHRLSWQDNLFISFEAIEQRLLKPSKYSVDPLEFDRLNSAKKRYKNEQKSN